MWEEFPPISTAEWEATIRADLKGADYAKKLVWSRTSLANKSLYDLSANLMRCITDAMSAIFGGCDYLIVEAARFAQHLAESLPRVLGEESHFDQVSDPGGGSFYIGAALTKRSIGYAEAWKVYEDGLAGLTQPSRLRVPPREKQ